MLSAWATRQRVVVLVAALLGAAITARLGWWQLDRAHQKLALQARMLSRAELPPLPLQELVRGADVASAGATEQHYRLIALRGRWMPEHTVYLDNRQMNARQGFFVITPLLMADGGAVLVQRGWSPRSFTDRTQLAPLATPVGEVVLLGRIAPPPAKLFEFKGADNGRIRQNLDLPAYAHEIGVALRPVSVQQTLAALPADPTASAPFLRDDLLRQWAAPTVDVSKHRGYALQWFALCALIAGLTLWFQLARPFFVTRALARGASQSPSH